MLRRKLAGALVAVGVLAVSAAPSAMAAPVSAAPAKATDIHKATQSNTQQVTLQYDTSRAAEFAQDVDEAAEIWNSAVQNVQLEPVGPGESAEIVIIADPGWPRAQLGPVRPGGQVTVWYGRQAVEQGYDLTRIAAHEMGHSLGLPDMKPGPCSSLMSGSTGGVECTNATPNAQEAAMVEQNYGSGAAGLRPADGRIIVDKP